MQTSAHVHLSTFELRKMALYKYFKSTAGSSIFETSISKSSTSLEKEIEKEETKSVRPKKRGEYIFQKL